MEKIKKKPFSTSCMSNFCIDERERVYTINNWWVSMSRVRAQGLQWTQSLQDGLDWDCLIYTQFWFIPVQPYLPHLLHMHVCISAMCLHNAMQVVLWWIIHMYSVQCTLCMTWLCDSILIIISVNGEIKWLKLFPHFEGSFCFLILCCHTWLPVDSIRHIQDEGSSQNLPTVKIQWRHQK